LLAEAPCRASVLHLLLDNLIGAYTASDSSGAYDGKITAYQACGAYAVAGN